MRRITMLMAALVAAGALTAGACAGGTDPEVSELEGNSWVLESLGDPGNPTPVLEGTEVTLTLDGEEKMAEGSTGCNRYFGSYEVKGTALTFGPIAQTEMACLDPAGAMAQEAQFGALLRGSESFKIEDGRLRITSSEGVLNFRSE